MIEERRKPADQAGNRPPYGRWEQAEDGTVALIGSRCTSCRETLFPERLVCPRCRGEALEEARLEGPAKLYSFTIVHQVPAGFTPPLAVGYVRFPEGVQVFGPIDGDPTALKPGILLALDAGVTKTDESGQPVVTYRFRALVGQEEAGDA